MTLSGKDVPLQISCRDRVLSELAVMPTFCFIRRMNNKLSINRRELPINLDLELENFLRNRLSILGRKKYMLQRSAKNKDK